MTAFGQALNCSSAQSLKDLARREAEFFKWLESERCGYDLGLRACLEWERRYWRVFCRHRHIDHLLGHCRIAEFDSGSFGRLNDPDVRRRPNVRVVIERYLSDGWENLDFYRHSSRIGLREPELHEALILVDINAVHSWLAASGIVV
jgi:hypothetical protein